jgi:hypothetical protein
MTKPQWKGPTHAIENNNFGAFGQPVKDVRRSNLRGYSVRQLYYDDG